MSSATANHSFLTTVATPAPSAAPTPSEAVTPAHLTVAEEDALWKEQNARETALLVKVTGANILILLVFFMILITFLGSNGRTQLAHTHQHPVAPVTRLGK